MAFQMGTTDTPGKKMVVDVWSDVACPFCYMGDALLEQALDAFPQGDQVDVRYHSFLLEPDMVSGGTESQAEIVARKYGQTVEQARANNERLAARAATVGLDYHMDDIVPVNMRRAHQLGHAATEAGKGREAMLALFDAHFTKGLDVDDVDVLGDIAEQVGLDRAATLEGIEAGRWAGDVDTDIEAARQLQVTGVPFYVFGGKFAVSGAQPLEVFDGALRQSWDEVVGEG